MRSLLCLAVLLFPCLSIGAEPFFEESLVWDFKEGGYDTHHVYGFAVTKKGTVLAFAGAREKAKADNSPKDQYLKRSLDGGKTWGPAIIINRKDKSYWNAHGHPGVAENWTTSVPVVDRITGKIFIFFALGDFEYTKNLQRVTRIFYRSSDDDGVTWSDRVDITDILNVKKDGSPHKDENGNWILKSRTSAPKNSPIFTRKHLQLNYNYTTPYLEI